eukprot:SAG11_NODE_21983_length_414_cov_1.453968_2_plen_22_part_01
MYLAPCSVEYASGNLDLMRRDL